MDALALEAIKGEKSAQLIGLNIAAVQLFRLLDFAPFFSSFFLSFSSFFFPYPTHITFIHKATCYSSCSAIVRNFNRREDRMRNRLWLVSADVYQGRALVWLAICLCCVCHCQSVSVGSTVRSATRRRNEKSRRKCGIGRQLQVCRRTLRAFVVLGVCLCAGGTEMAY